MLAIERMPSKKYIHGGSGGGGGGDGGTKNKEIPLIVIIIIIIIRFRQMRTMVELLWRKKEKIVEIF